ncbi:unnamed protein product [Strongylus vulgaris]|uniref:Uncharacterized protein n=1 Tax=Strongylus vulgaris TaxID=40348 RepID=A0A3P7L867_STRVU|nr:unnamed protein product [Strongylus vulgaris]
MVWASQSHRSGTDGRVAGLLVPPVALVWTIAAIAAVLPVLPVLPARTEHFLGSLFLPALLILPAGAVRERAPHSENTFSLSHLHLITQTSIRRGSQSAPVQRPAPRLTHSVAFVQRSRTFLLGNSCPLAIPFALFIVVCLVNVVFVTVFQL